MQNSNRIVVDYHGAKELRLLAVINTGTGEELDHIKEAQRLGVKSSQRINKTVDELVNICNDESIKGTEMEGFVLRYSSGLRVKIKVVDYIRLHRMITHFSSKVIWEILAKGETIAAYLEQVPDEFFQWAKEKERELKDKYAEIYKDIVLGYNDVRDLPTRKDQALKIMKDYKAVSGGIFSLLDDKQANLNDYIWKMIKPEYELPFKDVNREAE